MGEMRKHGRFHLKSWSCPVTLGGSDVIIFPLRVSLWLLCWVHNKISVGIVPRFFIGRLRTQSLVLAVDCLVSTKIPKNQQRTQSHAIQRPLYLGKVGIMKQIYIEPNTNTRKCMSLTVRQGVNVDGVECHVFSLWEPFTYSLEKPMFPKSCAPRTPCSRNTTNHYIPKTIFQTTIFPCS